jgi:hypothetical protein
MDYAADWVVLSPDASLVEALPDGGSSLAKTAQGFEPWTDERANVLGVMK